MGHKLINGFFKYGHPYNECYSVIKRNEVLIHAATRMKLGNIMLSERSHKRPSVV